jgi:hypothetical protein
MATKLNPDVLHKAEAAASAADAAASAAHHAARVAKSNVKKHWRPVSQEYIDRSIYGVTNAAITAATLADDASLAASDAYIAFRKAEDFFHKIEDIFQTVLSTDPTDSDSVISKATAAKAIGILSHFAASAKSSASAAATASDNSAAAAKIASEAFYTAATKATQVLNQSGKTVYTRTTIHAGDFVRAGESYHLSNENFEKARDAFRKAVEAIHGIRGYSQSVSRILGFGRTPGSKTR